MSGSSSTSVGLGIGEGGEVRYGGYRTPFTPVQWQELEHQAMIYKYLVAGLPVPPDLVMSIRKSFEARIFHHSSLGYCSYYGKKFDPEPGRCRRTDGKKWRCSKDAHPDSKYCERHMHRGRNRSRKHVESKCGGSFQNIPLYSATSSESSSPYGSSLRKLEMEPVSYGMDNSKEFRYVQGLTPDGFSPEASSALGLMPCQVSRQHSFLGSEKQEQHEVHPFFSEWPTTKESWSTLDGSNDNVFSSTQLSISIPRASSDFSSRTGYSPNDA